jgi:hypothetical protein
MDVPGSGVEAVAWTAGVLESGDIAVSGGPGTPVDDAATSGAAIGRGDCRARHANPTASKTLSKQLAAIHCTTAWDAPGCARIGTVADVLGTAVLPGIRAVGRAESIASWGYVWAALPAPGDGCEVATIAVG